jgi:hypothetical protein
LGPAELRGIADRSGQPGEESLLEQAQVDQQDPIDRGGNPHFFRVFTKKIFFPLSQHLVFSLIVPFLLYLSLFYVYYTLLLLIYSFSLPCSSFCFPFAFFFFALSSFSPVYSLFLSSPFHIFSSK